MQKKLVTMAGIAALCALLMAPLATATANAAPAHPATYKGTSLFRGDVLGPGDNITSADGEFSLDMQQDGNLVEYVGTADPYACWATNTSGQPGNYAIYQGDGNFVVYSGGGDAVWASNTVGDTGTTVDISTSLRQYGFLYVGNTIVNNC